MIPPLNTIICGDALEIMKTWPDKCVDITITSPPYNTLPKTFKITGMHKENSWMHKAVNGYSDNKDEKKYQLFVHEVVTQCLRISKGVGK